MLSVPVLIPSLTIKMMFLAFLPFRLVNGLEIIFPGERNGRPKPVSKLPFKSDLLFMCVLIKRWSSPDGQRKSRRVM